MFERCEVERQRGHGGGYFLNTYTIINVFFSFPYQNLVQPGPVTIIINTTILYTIYYILFMSIISSNNKYNIFFIFLFSRSQTISPEIDLCSLYFSVCFIL